MSPMMCNINGPSIEKKGERNLFVSLPSEVSAKANTNQYSKDIEDFQALSCADSNNSQEHLPVWHLSAPNTQSEPLFNVSHPRTQWFTGSQFAQQAREHTAKNFQPVLTWAPYIHPINITNRGDSVQTQNLQSGVSDDFHVNSRRLPVSQYYEKYASVDQINNQAYKPTNYRAIPWTTNMAGDISEDDKSSTISGSVNVSFQSTNFYCHSTGISNEEMSNVLNGELQQAIGEDGCIDKWNDNILSQYQPWSIIPLRESKAISLTSLAEEDLEEFENVKSLNALKEHKRLVTSLSFDEVIQYLSCYEALCIHTSSYKENCFQSSIDLQVKNSYIKSKNIIVKVAKMICYLFEMRLNHGSPDAYMDEIEKTATKSSLTVNQGQNPSWWGWWNFLFPHLSGLQKPKVLSKLVDYAFCSIIRKFQDNVPRIHRMGLKNLTVAILNKQSTYMNMYKPYKDNIDDTIEDMNSCLVIRNVFYEIVGNTVANAWSDESSFFDTDSIGSMQEFSAKPLCLGDFIQNEAESMMPINQIQIEVKNSEPYLEQILNHSLGNTGIPYNISFSQFEEHYDDRFAIELQTYFRKGSPPSYDADFPPL